MNYSSALGALTAEGSSFDGTNDEATAPTTFLPTAIFLIFMTVITAPANGFLLLALFKDPLRCFRSPSVLLVKSMSAANFLIGVLVEPLQCALYLSLHMRVDTTSGYFPSLYKATQVIAFLANNTSFITVAVLSVDHLIAVCKPMWYKTKLTKKKISMVILLIWLYSALFGFLALTDIPMKMFHKIDLIANTTTTFLLLLSSYVVLAISYSLHRKRPQRPQRGRNDKQEKRDKRFLMVIFLLLITASLTSFPSFVSWYLYHYCKACLSSQSFHFSFEIVQNLFYLKFATDPFLYAWRLPRYRRSLSIVLFCSHKSYNVSQESGHSKVARRAKVATLL